MPVFGFRNLRKDTSVEGPNNGRGVVWRVAVTIDWTAEFVDFLVAGCPQTDGASRARRVKERVFPPERNVWEYNAILVWAGFGKMATVEWVNEWASWMHMRTVSARAPVALMGCQPRLIEELRRNGYPMDAVGIVATRPVVIDRKESVFYSWSLNDGRRKADIEPVDCFFEYMNLFVYQE